MSKTPQLSTHATKDELRQEIAKLRHVGGMMSNLCFNLAQWKEGRPVDRRSMDDLRHLWDAIPRAEKRDA